MNMIDYSDADSIDKDIAIFYAKKLNNTLAEEFFNGSKILTATDDAFEVAKAFWEMTNLASTDHVNGISVMDNVDLEFWMHKLFNKMYGYYEKNGFKEQWKIAERDFG